MDSTTNASNMSNITNFNGADARQSRKPAHRDIGFVYVVEDAATGRVKIGMSRKPEQRIRSVMSSAGISGGRTYISDRLKNARALEAKAHLALAGSRLHGEFFMCSFEDAVSVVQSMSASNAADDAYTSKSAAEEQKAQEEAFEHVRGIIFGRHESTHATEGRAVRTTSIRQDDWCQLDATMITYHVSNDDHEGRAVGSITYDESSGLHDVSISPGFRVVSLLIEGGRVLSAYAEKDAADTMTR